MENEHDNFDSFQPIGLAADRMVSNLIKFRELPEMLDRSSVVSDSSSQRIIECPKMNTATALHEARYEALLTPYEVHSLEAGGGIDSVLVRVVLLAARFSEISEGVVVPPTVDVVDELRRPLTSAIEPRQTACFVEESVNADDTISVRATYTAGHLANEVRPVVAVFPPKHAGRSIVIEKPSQPFDGQCASANFVWHGSENSQNHERDRERDTPRQRTEEEKAEDERRYIKQRLREIAAFEQSYSTGRKDRR